MLSNAHSIDVDIFFTGGAQGTLESERQVPSNVVQFLRTLFPSGEINIEDASFQEISGSIPAHHSMASSSVANVQESESRTSDEGMFLSNIFHQIMPFTSQRGNEPDMSSVEANASERQNIPDSSAQVSNSDETASDLFVVLLILNEQDFICCKL